MTPYAAVISTFAIAGASFGTWASRIPSFKDALQLEPAQLGSILLVLALASIVSFPFAGRIMDLYGAARVSKGFTWATLGALLALSIAPNAWTLTVLVATFGATIGAMDVAMNGWGAEVERQRPKPIMSSLHANWSLFAGTGGLVGLGAVKLGLSVVEHIGLAVLLMSALAIAVSRVRWAAQPVTDDAPAFAWPHRSLLVVGLLMFCAALAEGAVADWAAIFLRAHLQVSDAMAISGFVMFSLTMFIGRMAADGLVAKHGAAQVCWLGGVLATLGVSLILLAPVLAVSLVGFALLGLGLAPVFPLGCARAANDPNVTPGQGLASVATLGYGGIMLGPSIIGFVAQGFGIFVGFGLILLCALYQVAFSSGLRR